MTHSHIIPISGQNQGTRDPIMHHRQLWWLVALLFLHIVSADDIQCPCVAPDACQGSSNNGVQDKSHTSCEDPTAVRCCDDSSHVKMVTKELQQEKQFMEAIDSLMEKIQQHPTSFEGNRDDKSLDSTFKNTKICEVGEDCDEELKHAKKEVTATQQSLDSSKTLSNHSKDLSDSNAVENNHSNSTREGRDDGKARKLVIVYAEKPNKNTTYEKTFPHIVYPSKEAMEEYLQSEESSIKERKLAQKEIKQENETEEKHDSEAPINQKATFGRPNLHKLFPKRNPPLKSSHLQSNPDDLGEAGSEIEEIKTSVPANVQTEQTLSRKPFRTLSRPILHRTMSADSSSQPSGASESQTGAKGKPSLPTPIPIDVSKTLQNEDPTAAIMHEINLKALNEMMKTNFTGQTSFPRRQRPNVYRPQTRLHTSSTPAGLSTGRTQQEIKYLAQSKHSQVNVQSGSEQMQVKTPDYSEATEPVSNSTAAAEVKGSRYTTRRRNQIRNQNSNLPTKFSTTVSMSQEQVFDTLKESKTQEPLRKRPGYRRMQVKSQSGTPNADLAEQTTASQSESSFGRRRSKFRQRTKVENTTPVEANNNNEPLGTRTAQNPGPIIDNLNPPAVNQQSGQLLSVPPSEVQPRGEGTLEEDLEGSGSEIQPQRVRVRGRFTPPQKMEQGFQPMFGPAELNVVGPVPAGFQDRARGFSNEDLGFELPRANLNPQFNDPNQFQFDAEEGTDKPLRLLPPVFPVPQPPTSSSSFPTTSDTFSDDELLPPLETPKPLSSETPDAAAAIMLDQHRDITHLNQEFNHLKTRYDMLLNRYAETLKIYNEKYRNLFGSSEESEK